MLLHTCPNTFSMSAINKVEKRLVLFEIIIAVATKSNRLSYGSVWMY